MLASLDAWFPPSARRLTLVVGDIWQAVETDAELKWFVGQWSTERIERTYVLVTAPGTAQGMSLELRASGEPVFDSTQGALALTKAIGWRVRPTTGKAQFERTPCDLGPNRPTLYIYPDGRIQLAE